MKADTGSSSLTSVTAVLQRGQLYVLHSAMHEDNKAAAVFLSCELTNRLTVQGPLAGPSFVSGLRVFHDPAVLRLVRM